MEFKDKLRELLNHIISLFVVHDDELKVEVVDLVSGFEVRIDCHPEDAGKIIGSKGSRFNAIKLFVETACNRNGSVGLVRRIKPGYRGPNYPEFAVSKIWPRDAFCQLASHLTMLCVKSPELVDSISTDEPDGSSLITICISVGESLETIKALSASLNVLFEASGYLVGRIIRVSISSELEPQPQTSKGRHANEVKP